MNYEHDKFSNSLAHQSKRNIKNYFTISSLSLTLIRNVQIH